MKKLNKIQAPKIIECYELGEWKITVIDEGDYFEFYLTGLSTTKFMFGTMKDTMEKLGQTCESIIMFNIEWYIENFENI